MLSNSIARVVPRYVVRSSSQRMKMIVAVTENPMVCAEFSSPSGINNVYCRYFSEESKGTKQEDDVSQDADEAAATESTADSTGTEDEVTKLEAQVKDLKNQVLRALADQENTRTIAKRDVESARQFAVTSFAKSLLDVSDNLERALESVPEELRADKEKNMVLASLYEGIQMTDVGLSKAFEKNGLKKYGMVGDIFDPNQHEALFKYPDPEKEPGSIGQVIKKGFMLNGRPIRVAEVGVVEKA